MSRASCRRANGSIRRVRTTTTEVVLQRYRGELTMLDTRRDGADAASAAGDYGQGAAVGNYVARHNNPGATGLT